MKLKSILICKQSETVKEEPIMDVCIDLSDGVLLIMDSLGYNTIDKLFNCRIIGIHEDIINAIGEEKVGEKPNRRAIFELRYIYMRPKT